MTTSPTPENTNWTRLGQKIPPDSQPDPTHPTFTLENATTSAEENTKMENALNWFLSNEGFQANLESAVNRLAYIQPTDIYGFLVRELLKFSERAEVDEIQCAQVVNDLGFTVVEFSAWGDVKEQREQHPLKLQVANLWFDMGKFQNAVKYSDEVVAV